MDRVEVEKNVEERSSINKINIFKDLLIGWSAHDSGIISRASGLSRSQERFLNICQVSLWEYTNAHASRLPLSFSALRCFSVATYRSMKSESEIPSYVMFSFSSIFFHAESSRIANRIVMGWHLKKKLLYIIIRMVRMMAENESYD